MIKIIEKDEYLSFVTKNGHFIVSEENGKTEICICDHAMITIEGKKKQCLLITIDSGEFPTKLKITETESVWQGKIDETCPVLK
jgi:hypothetical protein